MRLDGQLLRRRRLQLGLTSRELARRSGTSTTAVTRLETTGDASGLMWTVVCSVVRELGFRLPEALADEGPIATTTSTDLVAAIGSHLQERRSGITADRLALTFGVSSQEVRSALEVLDGQLRRSGIRVHQGGTGRRLVPATHAPGDPASPSERMRHLDLLKDVDRHNLYRVMSGKTLLRAMSQRDGGTASLQRLERAGLVTIVGGEIRLSDDARLALCLDGADSGR